MAAKKFVRLVTGRLTEIVGIVVSTGAPNDGDFVSLDATGKFDSSVLPVGIGADTKSLVSSENLAAGDFINVWDDSGTAKARRADGSDPAKFASGFVLAGVTAPAAATVYLEGTNTQLSSRTPGARQYLSGSTPGAVVETPPSTAGFIVQCLGTAISATEVSFEHQDPITLA